MPFLSLRAAILLLQKLEFEEVSGWYVSRFALCDDASDDCPNLMTQRLLARVALAHVLWSVEPQTIAKAELSRGEMPLIAASYELIVPRHLPPTATLRAVGDASVAVELTYNPLDR